MNSNFDVAIDRARNNLARSRKYPVSQAPVAQISNAQVMTANRRSPTFISQYAPYSQAQTSAAQHPAVYQPAPAASASVATPQLFSNQPASSSLSGQASQGTKSWSPLNVTFDPFAPVLVSDPNTQASSSMLAGGQKSTGASLFAGSSGDSLNWNKVWGKPSATTSVWG